MKKTEMIEKILADMKAKQSPYDKEDREAKYGPWLRRQSKETLEEIMKNRKIG